MHYTRVVRLLRKMSGEQADTPYSEGPYFSYVVAYGGKMDRILQVLSKEEGVTSIEYALIAGLVVIGIVVSVTSLRDALIAAYNSVALAFGG